MEVIVFFFFNQTGRSQCLIPVHVLIEKESIYHIFTLLMRNYGMMDETQKIAVIHIIAFTQKTN